VNPVHAPDHLFGIPSLQTGTDAQHGSPGLMVLLGGESH
jgi:hypothetical protein